MPSLFRNPTHLLAAQSSVATRRQLANVGFSEAFVRAQVAARRWRVINDAVVVTHNGPLTRQQQLLAVWLSCPAPAAICARAALSLRGMSGVDDDPVHVLVVRGAKPLPTPDIRRKVHESRRFGPDDVVHRGCDVAMTGPARSAVDAAVWTPDPREAVRIVVNSVQQRVCDASDLLIELDKAGKVRHRRLLARALADINGGAQALSELAFLKFCRRHGLPEPVLQARLDVNGRRRYLDATFRPRAGHPVRVEIDGGVHLTLTQRWRDTRNDNEAIIAGELVLRYPSVAIHTDDPVVVAQIRRAIGLSEAGVAIAT